MPPHPNNECRIAFVDESSLYTTRLMSGLGTLGLKCQLYGPKRSPPTKSYALLEPGREKKKIWGQFLFPFQLFREISKDRPRIVHFQFEFFGIHSYGRLYSSLGLPLALLLLRLLRLKSVVTLHVVIPRDSSLRAVRESAPGSRIIPTLVIEMFLLGWYGLVSKFASGLVVHANVFKRQLVEQYKTKPSKIGVIPHGVDTVPLEMEPPKSFHNGRRRSILYFGVISPRKGLENLINAYDLLLRREKDDCILMLAGASPPYYDGYDSELRSMAHVHQLDERIRFLGEVNQKQASKLFSSAEFVVLPYKYNVGASGSLSWALGHGVPVLATDTEYFAEEVSQGRFGLLVKPDQPKLLADAMEKLLSEESALKEFSANSRRLGMSRAWSSVAAKTLEFYVLIGAITDATTPR